MKDECEGIPDYLLSLPVISQGSPPPAITFDQEKNTTRLEQLEKSENVHPHAKIFLKSKNRTEARCSDDRLSAFREARRLKQDRYY